MRLAFCSSTETWAGVKTWTLESAAALAARGHETFVYGKGGSAFARRARSFKLCTEAVGRVRQFSPGTIRFFKHEFDEKGIDAVFVHDGHDLRTAGIAARMLGIPVIRYVATPSLLEDSFSARMVHRFIRPHYIAPSRHVHDMVHKTLPFLADEQSSVLLPAKAPLREPSRTLSRPLRIVSTSKVHPRKGHVELAHTLARLGQEGHAFEWHIAGIGESMDELRMECSRLGIANRVRFYGFMHDVRRLLLECDVFVLSSYAVGQGSALLEAMACSLVPVARNVGGIEEYWPEKLSFLLGAISDFVPASAWHGKASEEMPLYAPLKHVFTAEPKELVRMKYHAWRHLAVNFSLGAKVSQLESLVSGLLPGETPSGEDIPASA